MPIDRGLSPKRGLITERLPGIAEEDDTPTFYKGRVIANKRDVAYQLFLKKFLFERVQEKLHGAVK